MRTIDLTHSLNCKTHVHFEERVFEGVRLYFQVSISVKTIYNNCVISDKKLYYFLSPAPGESPTPQPFPASTEAPEPTSGPPSGPTPMPGGGRPQQPSAGK